MRRASATTFVTFAFVLAMVASGGGTKERFSNSEDSYDCNLPPSIRDGKLFKFDEESPVYLAWISECDGAFASLPLKQQAFPVEEIFGYRDSKLDGPLLCEMVEQNFSAKVEAVYACTSRGEARTRYYTVPASGLPEPQTVTVSFIKDEI